jgi:hypothetical protein
VQILGLTVGRPTRHEQGGLDYVDVEARPAAWFRATSFGGFSGGGLWVVDIFANPRTGKIDSLAKLEGVAFGEFNVANGQGTIRCRGRGSIEAAMSVVPAHNDASPTDGSQ